MNKTDGGVNTALPARWFRMYAEFMNDPKVQMLSETDQRRYVMALCLRCSNGDVTLHDEQFAWCMRISADEWTKTKQTLIAAGLLNKNGHPPSWDKRQYASDSSKERVARHRAKKREQGLKGQNNISKALRQKIYKKGGNKCVYCGSVNDLTIDHKIPPIRGGSELGEDNLQTCCRICNADKRHMTHDEYLAWNGRVTLLKRPQSTETETEREIKPSLSREELPLKLVNTTVGGGQ